MNDDIRADIDRLIRMAEDAIAGLRAIHDHAESDLDATDRAGIVALQRVFSESIRQISLLRERCACGNTRGECND